MGFLIAVCCFIVYFIFLFGSINEEGYKSQSRKNAKQNGIQYYSDGRGHTYSAKTGRQVLVRPAYKNGKHVVTLYDVNDHKIYEAYDTKTGEFVWYNGK